MQEPSPASPSRAVVEQGASCSSDSRDARPRLAGRARRCPRCWRQNTRAGGARRERKLHTLTEHSALEGTQGSSSPALLWMAHTGFKPWFWCYQHHGLTTEPMAGSAMPYCHNGCSGKQITFYKNKTFYIPPVRHFTRVWPFCLSCLWRGLYIFYYVLYIPIYTSLQITFH